MIEGLAGLLIVDDDSATSRSLPHTYGVDDCPLIIQSLAADKDGGLKYDQAGFLSGNLSFPLLVNGTNVDDAPVTFSARRTRTRFRVLNGSAADQMVLTLSDGTPITQVATDAAYLTEPFLTPALTVSPGQRAEIVLDTTHQVTLRATLTAGTFTGGSGTHDVVTIVPLHRQAVSRAVPTWLNKIERLDPAGAFERTLRITLDNGLRINGVLGTSIEAMQANMLMATLGNTEVWSLVNDTQFEHPFHIHDVPHQILSYDGAAPTGNQLGWQDTTLVPPHSTVKIVLKFIDFADPVYMYMLHCHNLIHEDAGMMLGLMVLDPNSPMAPQ